MRIVAFTVSAAFAGAGGALFVFLNGYISPDSFTLQTSILFLLALLFGGLGHVSGPVVGSLVLTLLPEMLTGLSDYRLILYGGLLLGSIYWLPTGVVGWLVARRRRAPLPIVTARAPALLEPATALASSRPGDGGRMTPLLAAEGVGISFGGVAALDGVSLAVGERGIFAVIGPNGAGKTTLLNVLSGYYAPAAGRVTLADAPVAGRSPFAIARLGVARTFQTAQVFPDLSVTENIAVGVAGHRLGGLVSALLGTPFARRRERDMLGRARRHAEAMGLGDWADHPAEALPAGSRRRLEIARALATSPRVLMLDEPAAGLGPGEIERLDGELAALRNGDGPAIVLVEHHMDLVMAVSDRVTVLDYGRVIATGSAAEVQQHPAVIEAYLGKTPASVEGVPS
jgi:ABC-type branched-subunit amino acid transport system ATPase component